MKTQLHKNHSTRWTINTISDIDAMSVAVPYCDAVVTDRQARDALRRSERGQLTATSIIDTPEHLCIWLENLP